MKEIKRRFHDKEISLDKQGNTILQLKDCKSYKKEDEMPKQEMQPGKIFVDQKHFAVLFPVSENKWLPIHIVLIKSCAVQLEGNWSYLRINLSIPGQQNITQNMEFPHMEGENKIYLRELTFKSTDSKYMDQTLKDIRELIKKFKQKDKERHEDQSNAKIENLIPLKDKKIMMDHFNIRPNLGKKTVGSVEAF